MASWILVNSGLGNGLLSVQHQAIISTTANLLPIGHLGKNFSQTGGKTQLFPFKEIYREMLFA